MTLTACFQAFAGFYLTQGFKAPSLDIKRLSVPGPSGPVFRVESWRWSSFCAPKIPRQKVHQLLLALGTVALLTPFTPRGTRLKEVANDKWVGRRIVPWLWNLFGFHSRAATPRAFLEIFVLVPQRCNWGSNGFGVDGELTLSSAHNKGDHSIREALCLGQFRVIESRVRSRSLISHCSFASYMCFGKMHTHTHWWLVSPAFPACFWSPDRIEGSVHLNHEEMFHELILSEKKDAPKLNPRWSNRGLKAKIFGRWSRSSFYARKESLLSPKAVTFMAWKVSWTCKTWRDPTNTQNVVICLWSIYELW